MLGLRRGTVALESYTSDWVAIFENEARRLRHELGSRIIAVEHIGSTSIPGMDAKPILDMMVGIQYISQADSILDDLVRMGYQRRVNGDLPDRVFLVKGPEIRRIHHLSITYMDSPFWKEHILFRDALRQNDVLAAEYLDLKRRLAERFGSDRNSYTAGKEKFVRSILALCGGHQD